MKQEKTEEEEKTSEKENSTPPPSDESESDPDRGSSVPVFVQAPSLRLGLNTPAVRIMRTKPLLMIGIFPLTRIELGEVYTKLEELSAIDVTEVPGGWFTAPALFEPYVDYPMHYLRAAMGVLSTQMFMDSTALQWNLWKEVCKTSNKKLYASIVCPKCKQLRMLSMRNLYSTLPMNLQQSVVNCTDVGLKCGEQVDDVLEAVLPVPPPSSSSNELPTSHAPVSAKEDPPKESQPVTELQIVPYKPAPGLERPNGYVTWSQMIPPTSARQALDAMAYQQYYDPYDAVHAAPEHFISGSPLTKFVASDPSAMEISEFKLMQSTSEWRDIFRDFSKWSDAHKEAQYNGDEDITLVFRWSTAMRARFLYPSITNSIARAELASTTLTHRARSWWLAHRMRAPKLLVTFDQLLEWIKKELVPYSSTSDAVNAWCELTYTGDAKKYISDLEKLINHFPLRRESILIMSTRPLGKEIQKRVQLMDVQHGPSGITIAQLKQAIAGFLSLSQYSRPVARDREWDRQSAYGPRPFRPRPGGIPQYHIRKENIPAVSRDRETKQMSLNVADAAVTREREQKPVADVNRRDMQSAVPTQYRRMKIGIGPTPCFVCGTDKHAWIDCPKKKRGKCACCGSEAHLTRSCFQRYVPEVRMSFHLCAPEDDPNSVYIPENDPCGSTLIEEIIDEQKIIESEEVLENEEQLAPQLASAELLESNQEEELIKELEQVQFSFHVQSLGMPPDQNQDLELGLPNPATRAAYVRSVMANRGRSRKPRTVLSELTDSITCLDPNEMQVDQSATSSSCETTQQMTQVVSRNDHKREELSAVESFFFSLIGVQCSNDPSME